MTKKAPRQIKTASGITTTILQRSEKALCLEDWLKQCDANAVEVLERAGAPTTIEALRTYGPRDRIEWAAFSMVFAMARLRACIERNDTIGAIDTTREVCAFAELLALLQCIPELPEDLTMEARLRIPGIPEWSGQNLRTDRILKMQHAGMKSCLGGEANAANKKTPKASYKANVDRLEAAVAKFRKKNPNASINSIATHVRTNIPDPIRLGQSTVREILSRKKKEEKENAA